MRNKYKIIGDTVIIELTRKNGEIHTTSVSLSKLGKLLEFDVTWCLLDQKTTNQYVMTTVRENGKQKTVRLHRFLLDAPLGSVVNHINGNGTDNTDDNLEIVTNQVNTVRRTRRNSNNTSGIRGVSYSSARKKWEVKFKKDGTTHHFGRYKEKSEAEIVARRTFFELFGDMANKESVV